MESSSLNSLEKRLKIEFPHHLDNRELIEMFEKVARFVPCIFQYSGEVVGNVGRRDSDTVELLPPEHYLKSINGMVIHAITHKGASFRLDLNNDYNNLAGDTTRFVGLKFETTPGYNTIESLKGRFFDDLPLMDSVRDGVELYFSERRHQFAQRLKIGKP